MRDIHELLRTGAGEHDASFGVEDVFQRSSALRRRRLLSLAALSATLVIAVIWVATSGIEWFTSAPDPARPVVPGEREAVLVYSSEGDIFAVTSADSAPQPLVVTADMLEQNPAISPDGSTLVFERSQGPDSATNWALHALPIKIGDTVRPGGESVQLTSGERAVGYDRTPAWSPDGRRIAFTRHIASGSEILGTDTALVVMNSDGSGQQELTERPDDAALPAWSSDGASLFFTTVEKQRPYVARVSLDNDGEPEVLTQGAMPALVDDDRVAFLRMTRPALSDVFTLSLSSGREQRWTRGQTVTSIAAAGSGSIAIAEGQALRDPITISLLRRIDGRPEALVEGIRVLEGFSLWTGPESERSPDQPPPSTVFFPTWTAESRPAAIVGGTLVESDDCLFLRSGARQSLALWERGYTYADGALRTETGEWVADLGEAVRGGGGYYSDLAYVQDLVGESIPSRCQPGGAEPYVLIYDVERDPQS